MKKMKHNKAILAILLFVFCYGFATTSYGANLMGELQKQTVVNQNGVLIQATGTRQDDYDFYIQFTVQNNSAKDLCVQVRDLSVNGWMIDPTCSCDVMSGKSASDHISLSLSDIKAKGISQITTAEFVFDVFDNDTYDDFFISNVIKLNFTKHTHTYDESEVTIEPTCVKSGIRTYTCVKDGDTKTETIPATGNHQWSSWFRDKDPTCVNSGTDKRSCYVCDKEELRPVPPTGEHFWSIWDEELAATCEKAGREERHCYDCNKKETRTIKATGHKWSPYWITTREATCAKAGIQETECYNCGKKKTRSLPVTSKHTWSAWKTIIPATISKLGTDQRICTVCKLKNKRPIVKLKPFVKFAKKTVTIKKGKSLKLKISYAAGDKVKSWKSSKKSVVTVNSKGKIKAKKAGTAKITVTMKSGKKATCTVKVK